MHRRRARDGCPARSAWYLAAGFVGAYGNCVCSSSPCYRRIDNGSRPEVERFVQLYERYAEGLVPSSGERGMAAARGVLGPADGAEWVWVDSEGNDLELDRMEWNNWNSPQSGSWEDWYSYYDVEVNGKQKQDAAWFYREPKPAAKQIEGYVAFWKGVKVEK